MSDAGWTISESGLLAGAQFIVSPNADARPPGVDIELLVIHGISLPPGEFGGAGVVQLFTNTLDPNAHPCYRSIASLRVSSHFFVRRDGAIVQFVPCTQRAWHAGVSSWRGRSRCNDFSVGVELEGADEIAYADAQYVSLAALTHALTARYPIVDITGHSDISPGRKTDPGAAFDWARYRGLAAAG